MGVALLFQHIGIHLAFLEVQTHFTSMSSCTVLHLRPGALQYYDTKAKKEKDLHRRGVEPLPLAWKASMITASPSAYDIGASNSHHDMHYYRNQSIIRAITCLLVLNLLLLPGILNWSQPTAIRPLPINIRRISQSCQQRRNL